MARKIYDNNQRREMKLRSHHMRLTNSEPQFEIGPDARGDYSTYSLPVASVTTRELASRIEGLIGNYSGIARQKTGMGLRIEGHADISEEGARFHVTGYQWAVGQALIFAMKRVGLPYQPINRENVVRLEANGIRGEKEKHSAPRQYSELN